MSVCLQPCLSGMNTASFLRRILLPSVTWLVYFPTLTNKYHDFQDKKVLNVIHVS
jgi:hypothetical protein